MAEYKINGKKLLERVIAEGRSGFHIKSILGPDSDTEIHWSIPKELKADIEKYLAKTKSRPTIRTKKGQANLDLIYDYIVEHVQDYGYPPSVREIQYDCEISSTSVVNYYLEKLEEEGRIKRAYSIARGITVL